MSASYDAISRNFFTEECYKEWYKVRDYPLTCQKISNLFSYHQLAHILTPSRTALFARLHILDTWGNTTCTFGECERCYAPLDRDAGTLICIAFGEFCFEAENPLIDAETLAAELTKFLCKSHCTAHGVFKIYQNAMNRKMEYYLPFVMQWRQEILCHYPLPSSSPEMEKSKHSKLSVLMAKSGNSRLVTKKRDSVLASADLQHWEKLSASTEGHGYHARMSLSNELDRQETDRTSLHSVGSRNEKQKRHWRPFSAHVEGGFRMEID